MRTFRLEQAARADLAVKAAVDHVNGVRVEASVDTGVGVVTLDNVDSPELAEILNPPLTEYLGGR